MARVTASSARARDHATPGPMKRITRRSAARRPKGMRSAGVNGISTSRAVRTAEAACASSSATPEALAVARGGVRVVDDRLGVVGGEEAALGPPRLVDGRAVEVLQLRHVAAHVLAVRIEALP